MAWDHVQSLKEVVRHSLHIVGLDAMISTVKGYKGYEAAHLDAQTTAERFRAIYQLQAWVHHKGQTSSSGRGSEVAATGCLIAALPQLLLSLKANSVLDVGCGDWNWMRQIEWPCPYVGVDIVPELIEANRVYERDGVEFRTVDAIAGPLPEADVAICREVLFHLSFSDAMAVLRNICCSAQRLIATTDERIWFNSNIKTGDFRLLNLLKSPFNFPPPHQSVADGAVSRGRRLGIWSIADLPKWNIWEKAGRGCT